LRGERSGYDFRPQIVGVFTDLSGPAPPGLQFSATVDSRYSISPTLLKMLAMIVGVAMTVIALGALHVLDTADGRRVKRFLPPRWWSVTPLDGVVTAVLVWWHFVGANTSDDGYILTMARVSEHAGYMANYYRWFGTPEAPFGWYYDLLALWAHVSTNSAWVRLPTLVMALACWWLISREVIPRLGHASRPAEPRHGRRRYVPGVLAAAEQRAAAGTDYCPWHPADLVLRRARRCHQPHAAGGHRDHHRRADAVLRADGHRGGRRPARRHRSAENHCGAAYFAVRSSGSAGADLAACTVTIILIFRDRALAGEMGRTSKSTLGPSLSWFDEHIRYGGVIHHQPRRLGDAPVRGADTVAGAGRLGGNVVAQRPIPGTALGPSRRIVGITIISFLAMRSPHRGPSLRRFAGPQDHSARWRRWQSRPRR
jgi:arabinosyltransferase C